MAIIIPVINGFNDAKNAVSETTTTNNSILATQTTIRSDSTGLTTANTAVANQTTIAQTTIDMESYLRNEILLITYAKMKGPNSVGGWDFDFDIINKSEKTIKYISFKVGVGNAVGDILFSDIDYDDDPFFGLKMTGPIEQDQAGGKGRVWADAFYNSTAVGFDIMEIRIEYMDGSFYTIDHDEADLID